MKKTKHFNISVPELGDVPDITQVSNAISDLEDATAGTLEIMKAGMQGTKITLTSVSRKTKRTGYYEGMSIRFKSPQDIEPNYLKTISVDDLGAQTLSVEYKVNRNEYIDIVYEGNKFTAYPVVVQKTDSVSENSSVLVGTAKGVKTAYDKGVEALNKANQAQSSADKAQSTADGKVSKSGDTMTGRLSFSSSDGRIVEVFNDVYGFKINNENREDGVNQFYINNDGTSCLKATNLNTQSKEVVSAINELNSGKENKIDKKSGFNLEKTSDYNEADVDKVFTQAGAKSLHTTLKNSIDINSSNIAKCLKYDIKNDNLQYPLNIATEGNPKYQLGVNSLAYNLGLYSEYGTIRATGLMGDSEPSGGSEHLNYAWYIANNVEYDLSSKTFKRRRTNTTAHVLITGDHEHGMSLYRVDGEETNLRKNAVKAFSINTTTLEGYIADYKILTTSNINKDFCPYQIGDILATSNTKNPNTNWPGTSWERIANGRALVGVDEGQSEFNTVMKQGGEKTHTLTINEMPAHNHGYTGVKWDDRISVGDEMERGGLDNAKITENIGGGQAHNNLQPYLTVYYWRRIG